MAVMHCEQLREVAPDVALGLLTGEERAAALAHLERCEACRAEVAALAGTADEVLLAAPEVSPPADFTAVVLSRLAEEQARGETLAPVHTVRVGAGQRARRRGVVAALAAAAAAVLVVAGIAVAGRPEGSPTEVAATAEMRTGEGQVVGQATVRGDEPASVVVDVPGWAAMVERWDPEPGGRYWLAVETSDGARTMRPALTRGYGAGWSVTVDAEAGEVTTVSVLDGEGRVWCTGRFGT